jgi:ribosomal protein S18 acetylase RimI-like enzyme
MTHRVVPMAEEHIEGFRAALDSVAREQRFLAMLEAPPIEELGKFVKKSIAAGEAQVVAIVDGRLVGWCDVLRKARPTLRHSGVLGMGVMADYRGRGIGKALMGAVLEAAKEKGFKRVELTVRVDNPRAKKLYEQFGFVEEGLCRRHMCLDGEYTDSYLMAVLYD